MKLRKDNWTRVVPLAEVRVYEAGVHIRSVYLFGGPIGTVEVTL